MSESFSAFLSRIGQIRVLTKPEEVALAKRIQAGDHTDPSTDAYRAKQTLVEHNIRLAVHIARRYNSTDVPFEDLVQEAVMGVNRAAEKFEWQKGNAFSTYATWWIRHFIQRALYKDKATIRVPGHIIARKKAVEKYLREHPGHSIEDGVEAGALDMTLEQAEEAMDPSRVVQSLDAPFIGDEGGGGRHELHADDNAQDPAEVANDPHPELTTALGRLPDLERRVIELRFGLTGGEVMSRDEVAEELGVRPHVVQRSQRAALDRLRSNLGVELPQLHA